MPSFDEFTDPVTVPYTNIFSSGFGYSVSFIGDRYRGSVRVKDAERWNRAYPRVLDSSNRWTEPSNVKVVRDGEWRDVKQYESNPDRVTKVQIFGYLNSLEAPGTCPSERIIFFGDGGDLNLGFPHTVPAGYRLTKIRVLAGCDDYWYWWFLAGSSSQFTLGYDGLDPNANPSQVDFQPNLGGVDRPYIHDKFSSPLPASCGLGSVSLQLGGRFPGDLNAAFPVMPFSVSSLYLAKVTGVDCGGKFGGSCETELWSVFLEFHSGNAVTNDGGQTWTAPQQA